MAARYPAETQCPGHAPAVFSRHHVETAQRHRRVCFVRATLRYAIDRKRSICEQATNSYWPIGTRHQLVSVRCKAQIWQIWQTPVARNRGSRAHEFAGMHAILNAHRPLQRDCASMVDGVCFTIVGTCTAMDAGIVIQGMLCAHTSEFPGKVRGSVASPSIELARLL